jgi:hypothetical protein
VKNELKSKNLKIFALMLFSGFWVRIFGQLYIVEIAFILIILRTFFLGRSFRYLGDANIFRYLGYLSLALVGQLVTDLVRGTDSISFLKGSSLIIVSGFNLVALSLITRLDYDSTISAILGWAFGILIGALIQPSEYAIEYPWKFGFGYAVTLLVLLFISKYKISNFLRVFAVVILVAVDLVFGARSLAAITFISVAISIVSENIKINSVAAPKKKQNLSIFFLGFLVLFYFSYSMLASNGYLGEDSKQKFEQQSSSSLGLLIAGRTEVVSQFIAISKSPIIGYGSYAPLTSEIREVVVKTLSENGINPTLKDLKYGVDYRIPVHSGIFEFWLWFGILGLPFFLRILRQSIQVVIRGNSSTVGLFLCIQAIWDTLFSPYAADRRIQFPLTILIITILLRIKEKKL